MISVKMTLCLLLRTFRINKTYCVCVAQRAQYISSKIPEKPQWIEVNPKDLPEVPELTDEMVNHLERLSLVDFNNKAGVERLRSAIGYANQINVIDTEGVEPLYSVLEGRELLLRDDVVNEGGCKKNILQNAVKLDEDYFVAPPGNIPLNQSDSKKFADDNT